MFHSMCGVRQKEHVVNNVQENAKMEMNFGTHDKNRPHGIISCEVCDDIKKLEVTLTDINGILYYIDNIGNVYVTEEVLNNTVNPEIYAKYTLENGVYKII